MKPSLSVRLKADLWNLTLMLEALELDLWLITLDQRLCQPNTDADLEGKSEK